MDKPKPPSDSASAPSTGEAITRVARRKLPGRKLLVASIGVATINYAVACGSGKAAIQPSPSVDSGVPPTPANTVTPPNMNPPPHVNPPPTSANLVAPPPNMNPPPTSANLVAPPWFDAGDDAGSDQDGGTNR